jgi:LAO/AO transport system kinase
MVDCFLLLMLTGAGDELQGIKRGILELADVIAVNKADGANAKAAEHARAELERALAILRPAGDDGWTPRVVTSSGNTGVGLDDVWRLIEEHRAVMDADGGLERRRRKQLLGWMWEMVDEGLRIAVREHPEVDATIEELEKAILDLRLTPTAAAENILKSFGIKRI